MPLEYNMESTVFSGAVCRTPRMIRITVASFAMMVAVCCGKKDEECKALVGAIQGVGPALAIDVDDKKAAQDKAAELDKLLEVSRAAQQALRLQGPENSEVRRHRNQYQEALDGLVERAAKLKNALEQMGSLSKKLATVVRARQKAKEALNSVMSNATDEEKRTVSSTVGFGPDKGPGAADRLEHAASRLEKMTFSSESGKEAAQAYVAALRGQANVLRKTGEVEDQLTSVQAESESLKDAFAEARTELLRAHEAIASTCAPDK
jgi:DNA repair exonuclease SbcCD ATPase subunit